MIFSNSYMANCIWVLSTLLISVHATGQFNFFHILQVNSDHLLFSSDLHRVLYKMSFMNLLNLNRRVLSPSIIFFFVLFLYHLITMSNSCMY